MYLTKKDLYIYLVVAKVLSVFVKQHWNSKYVTQNLFYWLVILTSHTSTWAFIPVKGKKIRISRFIKLLEFSFCYSRVAEGFSSWQSWPDICWHKFWAFGEWGETLYFSLFSLQKRELWSQHYWFTSTRCIPVSGECLNSW